MIEYKIIENENRINFEKEVEVHLNDGWSLAGGVCVVPYVVYDRDPGVNVTYFEYHQAIFKEKAPQN